MYCVGDELIVLNSDDVSIQLNDLRYAIQLVRLGSQSIEEGDDELLAHVSLPRQEEQQSPFSFINSPYSSRLTSIETQLDTDEMTSATGSRTRFSLPTKNQLKLLVKGKRSSTRPLESIQQEGVGRRITVMAEVYDSPSALSDHGSLQRDGGEGKRSVSFQEDSMVGKKYNKCCQ